MCMLLSLFPRKMFFFSNTSHYIYNIYKQIRFLNEVYISQTFFLSALTFVNHAPTYIYIYI